MPNRVYQIIILYSSTFTITRGPINEWHVEKRRWRTLPTTPAGNFNETTRWKAKRTRRHYIRI